MSSDIVGGSGKSEAPIAKLAQVAGASWQNIENARWKALNTREKLREALKDLDGEDTSIVLFGSLARAEETPGSDVDWTLLVDGMVDPGHLISAQKIESKIAELKRKKPGREGTFGSLAFSHQIVHWIGGADDSNANTTRRVLLLLESRAIGRDEAWSRVINNVLSRYLMEDRNLWVKGNQRRVPLFLLNDLARYWRTMVVDFAYKQRTRANDGYALRSVKLGLSRKLIFAAGLLACFSCQQDFNEQQWQAIVASEGQQKLIEHLRSILGQTPLEMLASRLLLYPELAEPAEQLFSSYNDFLGLLADAKLRDRLDSLPSEKLEQDPVFQEARSIRRRFGESLNKVFLSQGSPLYDLTIEYGVF